MTESFRLVSNMQKSILEARFDEVMGFTINFTIDTRSEDDQYCGIINRPKEGYAWEAQKIFNRFND